MYQSSLHALQVVKALTDLKIIVSRGDDLSLRRAITYFLNNIAKQTEEQETIAAIGEDMFAVALDQPFRSPPLTRPVDALLSKAVICACFLVHASGCNYKVCVVRCQLYCPT